mmetsp:Transcript_59635/g.111594  ORF Transcript_59635/g.111594 Transcript_59635/m.111594 type:complete len:113 (+) Transcript_59635:135-473(+)
MLRRARQKNIKVCRCWQSKRFPYCDDTHKVLIEAGDNVGPYVVKINPPKSTTTNVAANYVQVRNQLPRTAAFFAAGFGTAAVLSLGAVAYARGFRVRGEVELPKSELPDTAE